MSTKKENVKVSKFVATGLKEANKSEADKLQEKITVFVEDSIIECESTIAQLNTSHIPSKKLEIRRAENDLKKAKAAYTKSKFTFASSFTQYLNERLYAQEQVDAFTSKLNELKAELDELNAQLKKYEEVLADLNATV
jgi:chromosome segregation ATPase